MIHEHDEEFSSNDWLEAMSSRLFTHMHFTKSMWVPDFYKKRMCDLQITHNNEPEIKKQYDSVNVDTEVALFDHKTLNAAY